MGGFVFHGTGLFFTFFNLKFTPNEFQKLRENLYKKSGFFRWYFAFFLR
jgi:hypothetical protein